MIVIIIESTKRRGRHLKKKICLTRIGHILFPMSPQWLRKSHIIELGCRGRPPEAMNFNEKKDQWNTSDPPNTWQNTWPPPLPIGLFIFNPPPQYITKKISDPPEYNRRPPPPPQLIINDSSLIPEMKNNVIMNVCGQPLASFSTQMNRNCQKAENDQMVFTY